MFDLIIVGSGPAGLTASIYASCFHLNHVVIGKVLGGQMSLAHKIINFPGFESITGIELTEKMASQAKNKGVEIVTDSVIKIEKNTDLFTITTESGKTLEAKTVILATGTERRKLNVPGEVQYTGKGILYCAPCDKQEYSDKNVAIIGGGNSAVSSAIQVAHAASKVYLIYRGAQLSADPVWVEQLKNEPKIEVLYNTQVQEITGDNEKLTKIKLSSIPNSSELLIEKLYIEIGGVPGTALLIPLGIEIDERGFIKVDDNLSTNVSGLFAAGDVVNSKLSIEQISSAVGLGARCAMSVFSHLKQQKTPNLWGESLIKR
ncbi:hypothetical protein C4559_00280 [Candidatus Microgenomates bacterium]|nr:MAG: hypothetical protein C4559_00280 [Candidatus Microgenomates bacterium]